MSAAGGSAATRLACIVADASVVITKLYNSIKDGPLGARIVWVEEDLGSPAVGPVA